MQDDKIALREIADELIDENGKTFENFHTLLMSLREEWDKRFKEKRGYRLTGKKIDDNHNTLLDIIMDVLRYPHDNIEKKLKDRVSDEYE